MCGIVGIASKTRGERDTHLVKSMMEALAHRGPDDEGIFQSDGITIGHKRLSIVDLDGGQQPIYANNGNVVAVNGMIYNFEHIRQDIPEFDYQSRSDSEVPLALYEKHGEGYAKKLRGMFAIALYDKDQDLLLLSRDSYGIKPLYYCQHNDQFIFASEPQALITAGAHAPGLNPTKAQELLQLKFTTSKDTVFEGIHRVLPGETLIIQNGAIVRRLRHDPFLSETVQTITQEKALKTLDELLRETLDLYVVADVPYGVFLSGGVDSCAVVAAMAKNGKTGFPCYTACFPKTDLHDETQTAVNVTKAVGAEHISLPITADDFWNTLPELISHVDDPTLDPAMIANFLLSRRAAKDVKVILCGDGGDEIFGGYRRYERALMPGFLKNRPLRTKGHFAKSGLLKINNKEWRDGFAESERDAGEKTSSRLQALQATDGADFMPHFHLMKLDRCLMAHGIEGRTPLIDQKLAEFAFTLPNALKLERGKGKLLLRQWLYNACPEAEPYSRKRGFSTPVNEWIEKRAPDLHDFICEQEGIRELFNINTLSPLFKEPAKKTRKWLWSVLYFALWHERHIKGHAFTDIDQFTTL